ncbi:MAG: right-handed parallel beta-helix repeat-containing protein [Armatimonadetes bacterium]|nr:right-handed parallel beta-helix repeat-containing protein [Armatimonadota bacterium]
MSKIHLFKTILLANWLAGFLSLPANASVYYVAQQDPKAVDTNPGTETRPFKTISAGIRRVQPGDTLYVKNGTYREEVEWGKDDWKDPAKRITLSAFPKHRPVIKGSEVVPGPWERLPGDNPVYATPRDTYTQMVFVDEERLQQIGWQGHPERKPETRGCFVWQKQWNGKGLSDMTPGCFFYDAGKKRLCVWLKDGSNPGKHVIEASVRPTGLILRGTWTVSGFDVRQMMDGLWPKEQAFAVSGNGSIVENCRITHNEFLGLIVSGEDCIIRNNVLAHNGLEGFTSNVGYRMLFEGNELHHNAWHGDVACGTAGNKWVMWRDCKILRNYWHDEPACALWLDISDANILIAENRFDDCAVGIYWEISRWAVIANNVFRRCGRAMWSYGADALIAHNVFDGCGEGVTISGYPRHCNYNQSVFEPNKECLMATRNNLVVNNLLIDCPGSYIGITEDTGDGAGNYSDYNAIVWTLPVAHVTGLHLNFMYGWNSLYARLPEWRMARHYDTHSVVCDARLAKELREGNPYVALAKAEVFPDAGVVARDKGDYRLKPDSPLVGKGVTLPMVLNSVYKPCDGAAINTRAWELTKVEDATGSQKVKRIDTWGAEHYRQQPLPSFHRLADLDSLSAGTPGLNLQWKETQTYPTFDASGAPDTATTEEWTVYPDNRLADPSFDKTMGKVGVAAAAGPWFTAGDLHIAGGMACANLFPGQQTDIVAYQKVGVVTPDCEYLLFGDVFVSSIHDQFATLGNLYLAAGDPAKPLAARASLAADPRKQRTWNTLFTRYHSGKQGVDSDLGKDLFVVLAARVKGPVEVKSDNPVGFVRWDNLVMFSGQKKQ